MQRSLFRGFFSVMVGVLFSGSAWASAGIDCRAQSLSRNEMAICRDASLSSAYQAMRQAYAVVLPAASAIDPGVSSRQEQWERAMLTQCADAACLQSNLANRTVQLQQALVKVNGVRQSRGEPPVSAPNPYAQAPQPTRQNFPAPVDRNPYVNEEPAPAVASPREVAVAPRTPAPTPVPAPAPVAPVEKQAPATVVAQAAPQAPAQPTTGDTPVVRKDLDPEQVKAILDAQKALLAKMNANDEKIAALEAQKAAVLAGQLAPEPAPEPPPAAAPAEPAPSVAASSLPSSGGVTVEPPPASTSSEGMFSAAKRQQWWEKTKVFLDKAWMLFLAINLGFFLYLNFKTDFRIFTNLSDMKFTLFVGFAYIISSATESKASPIIVFLINALVVGIIGWHTIKSVNSPLLGFFLIFAKYALVYVSFVYFLVMIVVVVLSFMHVGDRSKGLLSRIGMLFVGGAAAYVGGRAVKGYGPMFCQDLVDVSVTDYFKGTSSRKQTAAPSQRMASPKEPVEETSMG